MSLFTRDFLNLLEEIRRDEIHAMLPLLGVPGKLLEIGAGTGWQAKFLTDHGYTVDAIDIGSSEYREMRVWPVTDYDGHLIPFPDGTFDVVFSSNVMEHIPHVREFQAEVLRVLRPGGVAVHAMPTGTWRLWTSLTFYPWVVPQVLKRLSPKRRQPSPTRDELSDETVVRSIRTSVYGRLRAVVAAPRHGETGTMLGELWIFSKLRWTALFATAGFEKVTATPLRVTYSGYLLFSGKLSLSTRRQLSRWLGSSCIAYSMRKPARFS